MSICVEGTKHLGKLRNGKVIPKSVIVRVFHMTTVTAAVTLEVTPKLIIHTCGLKIPKEAANICKAFASLEKHETKLTDRKLDSLDVYRLQNTKS